MPLARNLKPTFHHVDALDAVWHLQKDLARSHRFVVRDGDVHFDVDQTRVVPEDADEGGAAVPQGVKDSPPRRLGGVLAVHVHTGPHFQEASS